MTLTTWGRAIGGSGSSKKWLDSGCILKVGSGNFPGGPVVKNLPCNVGDVSSIPVQGTKTPRATTRDSVNCNENLTYCS